MKYLFLIITLTALGVFGQIYVSYDSETDGYSAMLSEFESCGHPDSAALMAVYHALNGPNWTINTGWGDTCDICQWYGVICQFGGNYSLQIYNNNLMGSLPPEIGLLTQISALSLGPGITGSIPAEIGQLTTLNTIQLQGNSLSGNIPPEIGDLSNLFLLNLSQNQLTGSLPNTIGNLSGLNFLTLFGNQLNGSLPASVGNLSQLLNLSIYNNQFSGALPSTIGNMTSLQNLQISMNAFSGPIPDEFGQLGSLNSASMAQNQFTSIPTTVGNMGSLEFLLLADNAITAIPSELGDASSLRALQLQNNAISGNIPPELGQLHNCIQFWLQDNNLAGIIPASLGDLSSVTGFRLDGNLLSGFLPSELGMLLSGPGTGIVNLSHNQLEGCLPVSFQSFCDPGKTLIYDHNPCLYQGDFMDFCNGGSCSFSDYTLEAFPSTDHCVGSTTMLIASGGTSYQWSIGQTNSTINVTPLTDVTYHLSLTTSAGCLRTDSITIKVHQPPVASITGMDVTTPGGSDGVATAFGNEGVPPYNYQWNTGATTMTISGLAAGPYFVTVSDLNGCTDSASVIIGEPSCPPAGASCDDGNPDTYDDQEDGNCHCLGIPCPPIQANIFGFDLNCYQDQSGTIGVTPSGGSPPYLFSWSTGHTTSSVANLDSGTYHVTITDQHGCIGVDSILLLQPLELSSSISVTDESPPGAGNGAADLMMAGGTPPYEFFWSDGVTTEDRADLSGGGQLYLVTISDAHGCLRLDSMIINSVCPPVGSTCNDGDPDTYADVEDGNCHCMGTPCPKIISNIAGFDLLCYQDQSGSASASPLAGSPPYRYFWSTGDTSNSVNQLNAGTYFVTIEDHVGCKVVDSVVISQPTELSSSISVTPESAPGNNDGAAELTVVGGISPYQFIWSDGVSTEDRVALAGNGSIYIVMITDSHGCTLIDTAIIDSECVHQGTVCDDGDPQTFADHEDGHCHCAGTPCPTISIVAEVSSLSCQDGHDGSISLDVMGGTLPYEFNWSTGDTTANLFDLGQGVYSITVSDAFGCSSERTLGVSAPDKLTLSFVVHHESEPGARDGAVDLSVNGGTKPYQFYWSNNSRTEDISGLSGNLSLSVEVIDDQGCRIDSVITINTDCPAQGTPCDDLDPVTYGDREDGSCNCTGIPCPQITVNAAKTQPSCQGYSDGEIALTAIGGVVPYEIKWSDGSIQLTRSNLVAGTYPVSITDANGCSQMFEVVLDGPNNLNTSFNLTAESAKDAADGEIDLTVTGGTMPYQFLWNVGNTTEDLVGLVGNGSVYRVTVTDGKGCQLISSTTLMTNCPIRAQPCDDGDSTTINDQQDGNCDCVGVRCMNPSVKLEVQPISCHGVADGRAWLEIQQTGDSLLTSWFNGLSGDTIDGLAGGDYSVALINPNGCVWDTVFQIFEPTPLQISWQVLNASAPGQSDGMVSVSPSGGNPPYEVVWSNGDTTTELRDLSAQILFLELSDARGCQLLDTILIQADCPPEGSACDDGDSLTFDDQHDGNCHCTGRPCTLVPYSIIADPPSCANDADGSIEIEAANSNSALTFQWSNGEESHQINGLVGGIYSVKILDSNGCSWTEQISLPIPPALEVSFNTLLPSSSEKADGEIEAKVTGGSPPHHLQWSTGDTTSQLVKLGIGWYDLMVTDRNGCVTIDSVQLGVDPCEFHPDSQNIVLNGFDLEAPSTCQSNDGLIHIDAISALPQPLEFSIDDGANWTRDPFFQGLLPGRYRVQVRHHQSDCPLEFLVELGDQIPMNFDSVVIRKPSQCGHSDGFIQILDSSTHFAFSLDAGNTWQESPFFEGLLPGYYQIMTRNQHDGCYTLLSEVFDLTLDPTFLVQDVQVRSQTCSNLDGMISVLIDPVHQVQLRINHGPWQYETVFDQLEAGRYQLEYRDDSTDCIVAWPVDLLIEHTTLLDEHVLNIRDPSCRESDGFIVLETPSDELQFSIDYGTTWQQSGTFSGLSSGDYQILVQDGQKQCRDSLRVSLAATAVGKIVTQELVLDPSCAGGQDGVIEISTIEGAKISWFDGGSETLRSGLSAGVYEVILEDADGCSQEVAYELEAPDAIALAIPDLDSMPFCQGESIVFKMDPTLRYQWYRDNQLISSEAEFRGTKSGHYRVLAIDDIGCESEKSFSIRYSEEVFHANFLMSSQIVVGDTLVAIETTWPVPERVIWDIQSGFVIDQDLNRIFLQFDSIGMHTVRLLAYNGSCMSVVEKEVEVVKSSAQITVPGFYYDGIKDVSLYPNPNSGNFNVRIELTEINPIQIRIYDPEGLLLYKNLLTGSDFYSENIDLNDPMPGSYSLLVQSDQGWRSLHFVVD